MDSPRRKQIEVWLRSLLPCPCCGESQGMRREGEGFVGLYVGHELSDTLSVQCLTCGLRMVVAAPFDYPQGVNTLEELEAWMQEEAIRRWNRRVANTQREAENG